MKLEMRMFALSKSELSEFMQRGGSDLNPRPPEESSVDPLCFSSCFNKQIKIFWWKESGFTHDGG